MLDYCRAPNEGCKCRCGLRVFSIVKKTPQSILAFIFVFLAWSVEGAQAQDGKELSAEISFWETVRDSDRPEELQAYLDAFPDGRFATLAILRLTALGAQANPRSVEADQQTIAVDPADSTVGRLLEHCLATTAQARRGPFAGVVDPALALSLCDAAGAAASPADQLQIRESRALIHLSAQDYRAMLREATELLADRPGRGRGLSCLAETLIGGTDVERLCASAAAAGDIFGTYAVMLRAAITTPSALPQLLADTLRAQPAGRTRQDLERTIGLLVEDRLLSPNDLPDGVLARLRAMSLEELLTDAAGNGDAVLPVDLRLRAVFLARDGTDQGRRDAVFLLENAAAQGDRKAMMALGQSALEDVSTIAEVPDDLRQELIVRGDNGAAWLRRLVAVGPHQGAYYAVFAHLYGVGTERDVARASQHIGLIRGPEILEMRDTAEDVLSQAAADPNARANIRYLQLALARLGYDPGPSDGVLGEKTETAFTEFATDRRITDQPFNVENAVNIVSEWEKRRAARTDNQELDGELSGFLSNSADPLSFGWNAPYAF